MKFGLLSSLLFIDDRLELKCHAEVLCFISLSEIILAFNSIGTGCTFSRIRI